MLSHSKMDWGARIGQTYILISHQIRIFGGCVNSQIDRSAPKMECDRGKLASLGPIANSKFGVVRCDRVRIEGVGVGMGTHEIDRSECARFRTTRDSYPPISKL